MLYRVHLVRVGLELTKIVVIGIVCNWMISIYFYNFTDLERQWCYLYSVIDKCFPYIGIHIYLRVFRLLLEHRSPSSPVFSEVRATRSLVLYVMLCRSLIVLLCFFFCIIVYALLRFTASGYPFGIFKLFLFHGLSIQAYVYWYKRSNSVNGKLNRSNIYCPYVS